jgi:hypothetical protein
MGCLRRSKRRCEIHGAPWPLRTAQLEAELGIDPDAVTKLLARRAAGDPTASFVDPLLIDCGHDWCRTKRRE